MRHFIKQTDGADTFEFGMEDPTGRTLSVVFGMERSEAEKLLRRVQRIESSNKLRERAILRVTVTGDQLAAVNAVMAMFYNAGEHRVVRWLFPNAHPSYIDEKVALTKRAVYLLWGALDIENQHRLTLLALAHTEGGHRSEEWGGEETITEAWMGVRDALDKAVNKRGAK